MLKIAASGARKDFSKVIKAVTQGERILLCRHKKGLAAIVSVEDLKLLEAIEDLRDMKAANAARAEVQEKGTVPWEAVKANLGL